MRYAGHGHRAVSHHGHDVLATPDGGSAGAGGETVMDFYEVLAQVSALLQREGRTSYRALKRQFALDDDAIEDLKEELVVARRLAVDEDGRVLV